MQATACAVWCATRPDGGILFQETFYATGQAYLVGTVGGVKNDVQGRIVKRIAQAAVDLSRTSTPRGDAIEDTFSEFEKEIGRASCRERVCDG